MNESIFIHGRPKLVNQYKGMGDLWFVGLSDCSYLNTMYLTIMLSYMICTFFRIKSSKLFLVRGILFADMILESE